MSSSPSFALFTQQKPNPSAQRMDSYYGRINDALLYKRFFYSERKPECAHTSISVRAARPRNKRVHTNSDWKRNGSLKLKYCDFVSKLKLVLWNRRLN